MSRARPEVREGPLQGAIAPRDPRRRPATRPRGLGIRPGACPGPPSHPRRPRGCVLRTLVARPAATGQSVETGMNYPRRLIEVDLPIARISAHARREKSIRHGHISTLHIWWARRPLAACRAVICAALWPDPADPQCPPSFRDAAARVITDFARKV